MGAVGRGGGSGRSKRVHRGSSMQRAPQRPDSGPDRYAEKGDVGQPAAQEICATKSRGPRERGRRGRPAGGEANPSDEGRD